jgi:outer membrane protein assembly factor BamB
MAACNGGTSVDEISAGSSGVELKDQAVNVALEESWPWWRGPTSDGVAVGSAPTNWSANENVLWKADVPGRGHSSPIVCGNAVYLATADEQKQTQSVLAFDRESGEPKWAKIIHEGSFPSGREMHAKSTHANGSVACDGERIYTAFLNSGKITATALTLAGEIEWQEVLGAFDSKFGFAPSPIIYKSAVIFAADNGGGGHLSALDRNTGKTVWRKERPRVSTYSSPVIANVGGRDQLLISGARKVVSLDPLTGNPNWSCAGTAEATCGTVVWDNDRIYASGGYPENQTVCIDSKGKKQWSVEQKAYEPSMLAHDGALYCVTDGGIAYCWNGKSGEELWKTRLSGRFSASPVIANGLIYATNDGGVTFVFEASKSSYQEVATNRLGDNAFASPAICSDRIYLRAGGALYCIGAVDP